MQWKLLSLIVVTATVCAGQSPANAVKSPEVHPDGRITFRVHAPKASEVKLWGEWITQFNKTEILAKAGTGIWTSTIGPLPPGRYLYIFLIDGVPVLDPRNAAVATGRDGVEGNLVDVRGDTPLAYEEQSVPHGAVHMHWYESSLGLGHRRFTVYTPPEYARNRSTRYPVVYLLHGSGSTESSWTTVGNANMIADNLIAQQRIRPMLIVMPNGHASPPGRPDEAPEVNGDRFERDLLRDVMSHVESHYRVERRPQYRAIAGMSMGGFQALAYGLRHFDRFGSIGIFGAGAHGPEGARQVADAITGGNLKRVRTFWIGIGDKDPIRKDAQSLHGILSEHNMEHQYVVTPNAGRTWVFWRQCLADFLPQLFK